MQKGGIHVRNTILIVDKLEPLMICRNSCIEVQDSAKYEAKKFIVLYNVLIKLKV
jgi:hypothetical protein